MEGMPLAKRTCIVGTVGGSEVSISEECHLFNQYSCQACAGQRDDARVRGQNANERVQIGGSESLCEWSVIDLWGT